MKLYPITFKPFGQHAILIEWPDKVSKEILDDIIRFRTVLEKALDKSFEFVPVYNSIAIVSNTSDFKFDVFKKQLEELYKTNDSSILKQQICWEIPVCYDLEFGIDIEELASILKITASELIKTHSSLTYTVYGIGFLPGFMYLGGLPKGLETKRKEVPRLKVPKGAVGLAGKQTGIYPQQSPGGWNIIGNCPISLFNVTKKKPCFVSVGDKVKFVSVTKAAYKLHKIEDEVGIFKPKKIVLNA